MLPAPGKSPLVVSMRPILADDADFRKRRRERRGML